MKVQIQARHLELSSALRNYCETHLIAHLSRFYDDPAALLVIQFSDANGTKGGVDQEAHLTLFMPGARAIHVEQRTNDAFKSLDLARDRLIRRAKEEIRRWRAPSGHNPLGRIAAERERQLEAESVDGQATSPRLQASDPAPELK